jgi:hypothetical protein
MPDAKRAKRTSAEVTAATKRKDELMKAIELLDKQKVLAFAEMELHEQAEDDIEESNVVNEQQNRMEETPTQIEDMVEEDPADKSSDVENMACVGKKATVCFTSSVSSS